MNPAPHQAHPSPGRTGDRWLTRVLHHWPTLLRTTLIALVAAAGLVLLGSAADAVAAPPPPSPTADSGGDEPTLWDKWQQKKYELWVNEALDPDERAYKIKLPMQIGARRLVKMAGTGKTSFSWSQAPDFLEDALEARRRSQQTVPGLKKQVQKAGDKIAGLKKNVAQAKTPAERAQAEDKLQEARRQYQDVAKRLRAAKEAQPQDARTQLKELDQHIGKLGNRIRDLERSKEGLLPAGRELVQRQIDDFNEQLSQARADRDRLQGPPDGDDETGGTRTTAPGPKAPQGPTTGGVAKTPPQGPATTGTVKTPASRTTTNRTTTGTVKAPALTGPENPTATSRTTSTSRKTSTTGGTAKASAATVTDEVAEPLRESSTVAGTRTRTSPQNPTVTEQDGPQVAGRVTKTSPKTPAAAGRALRTVLERPTFTGSRALGVLRGGSTGGVATMVYTDLAVQGWTDYVSERDQKLYQKAVEDPALRKRAIDEYNDVMDNNEIEVAIRPFTGPEFTAGSLRDVGPELVEHENMLDTTKAVADESNSDPLYQQAQTECHGYDTCVTDRVTKLRTAEQDRQAKNRDAQIADLELTDAKDTKAKADTRAKNRDAQIADTKRTAEKDTKAEQDRQAKNRDAQIADLKQTAEHDTKKPKAEKDSQAKTDTTKSTTPKKKTGSDKADDKLTGAEAAQKKASDNKVATMKA